MTTVVIEILLAGGKILIERWAAQLGHLTDFSAGWLASLASSDSLTFGSVAPARAWLNDI
jgi:hypothetical protein